MMDRLYMRRIGPSGELLGKAKPAKDEDYAVAAYQAVHPFASAVELAEVRAKTRGAVKPKVRAPSASGGGCPAIMT